MLFFLHPAVLGVDANASHLHPFPASCLTSSGPEGFTTSLCEVPCAHWLIKARVQELIPLPSEKDKFCLYSRAPCGIRLRLGFFWNDIRAKLLLLHVPTFLCHYRFLLGELSQWIDHPISDFVSGNPAQDKHKVV